MIRKSHLGIEWLEFELFAQFPRLKHGIFLRHGGESQGKYSSLNLNYCVGDDVDAVSENLRRVSKALLVPKLCWSNQVHGKEIAHADSGWSNGSTPCDGIVTNQLNLGLMIHHADCQAAILYDPKKHVLANVHCGWRGSVHHIYANAVESMKSRFGCKPEDLHVGISPSLGPERAEFINYKSELPEKFWEFQVKPTYFDFWAISKSQLIECGILDHHIQIASICTYSNPQDYFSYRYSKIRGGHGTIASLA